jgi:hypothetical protein
VILPTRIRDELHDAVRTAALGHNHPEKPWALFGSAVMLLHGLREEIGDVDVFVQPRVWTVLAHVGGWSRQAPEPHDPPFLEAERGGLHVHAFFDWTDKDPEVDAGQCLRAAQLIDGWWCTPLEIVRMHKAMSPPKHPGDPRQEKHLHDVAAIDAHLRAAA